MRTILKIFDILFNAIETVVGGLATFTLRPRGRVTPLYGGGFEQDRMNLRGDVLNVAGDMRRAAEKVKTRMERRQGL